MDLPFNPEHLSLAMQRVGATLENELGRGDYTFALLTAARDFYPYARFKEVMARSESRDISFTVGWVVTLNGLTFSEHGAVGEGFAEEMLERHRATQGRKADDYTIYVEDDPLELLCSLTEEELTYSKRAQLLLRRELAQLQLADLDAAVSGGRPSARARL